MVGRKPREGMDDKMSPFIKDLLDGDDDPEKSETSDAYIKSIKEQARFVDVH